MRTGRPKATLKLNEDEKRELTRSLTDHARISVRTITGTAMITCANTPPQAVTQWSKRESWLAKSRNTP